MAQRATPPFELWRIPRKRYDRLVEAGAFDSDDRVELLDGLLVVREPQGSRHAAIVGHIGAVLERAFGRRFHVREDKPFALDDMSEPEPDLIVLRGRHLDYLRAHPSAPVLVVEVAESSLPKDRRLKAGLYARAGIADYWIVNLVEGVLEVYREPERAPARRHGWTYGNVQRLQRGDVVSPLAVPRVRLRVTELLPPAATD
jgi:Uma2 family endonuclease